MKMSSAVASASWRMGTMRFQQRRLVGEMGAEAFQEIGVERLPDIERAEPDAVLILEHMGDALGGGADDAEGKSTAHPEGEAGEGGDFPPGQGMVGVLAILALDAPEFAVMGFRDNVDALVGGGEFEFSGDGLRHFALEPDVLELAGVFGFKLEIGFDEFFKEIALLFFREGPPPGLDLLP